MAIAAVFVALIFVAQLNCSPMHSRDSLHRADRHQHKQRVISRSCLSQAADSSSSSSSGSGGSSCAFFSCAAYELECPAIATSTASKLCLVIDKLEHVDRQVVDWVQQTTQCVTQRIRHRLQRQQTGAHRGDSESSHGACADVDFRLRTDLHACAALHDEETCSTLLWHNRRSMLRLFADINWLWLVEIARSCPRDVTARFITWAMTSSDN